MEIEHQLDVLLERVGDSKRALGQRHVELRAVLFRAFDALLDGPHGLEVLGELHAVARPERALKTLHLIGHRIENAARVPRPREPLGGGAPLAEQAVEHHARLRLHRERRRRRSPRNRVGVETVRAAVARNRRRGLDGELERRQLRVTAQRVRRDLIHRRGELDLGAPGPRDGVESPLTTRSRSRTGARGVRIGESSNAVPSPTGIQ
jgi:hypothetical protein